MPVVLEHFVEALSSRHVHEEADLILALLALFVSEAFHFLVLDYDILLVRELLDARYQLDRVREVDREHAVKDADDKRERQVRRQPCQCLKDVRPVYYGRHEVEYAKPAAVKRHVRTHAEARVDPSVLGVGLREPVPVNQLEAPAEERPYEK